MESSQDFLSHLVGQWILTGNMGEVALRQEVTARWIPGDKFLWIYFKLDTPEGNPTSDYEAVYHLGFNEADQIYIMHLLDTTEVPNECVVGRGRRQGDSIPFLFDYGSTRFLYVFSWHPDRDSWSFRQTYEKDGETKESATKELTRVSG